MNDMKPSTLRVTTHTPPAARALILRRVPALRAMNDEDMADALVQLYAMGVDDANEIRKKVIAELGEWLAKLVAARVQNDMDALVAIIDQFMAARCIVKVGPAATPQH